MFCRENAFLVDLGDINSFEVRAKFLAVLFLEAVPRLKFKFGVFLTSNNNFICLSHTVLEFDQPKPWM